MSSMLADSASYVVICELPVLFDSKTPKSIAEKTGSVALMFYPSVGGKPEIKDYFDLFDYDIDQFVSAMKMTGKK